MRISAARAPLAVKGLALIFVLCVAVRLFSSIGSGDGSEQYMSSLLASGSFSSRVLDFELCGPAPTDGGDGLPALILGSVFHTYRSGTGAQAEASASPQVSAQASAQASAGPETTPEQLEDSIGLYYNMDDENTAGASAGPGQSAAPDEGPNSFVTPNIVTGKAEPSDLFIKNYTSYDVDIAALLDEPLNIALSGDSPAVLILHTHSSEAYMPDGEDQYTASDTFRTQEKQHSVIRVGDELASEFVKRGIAVIHDRNVYDYPSYQASYTHSYEAIEWYLETYPSIRIVIDLHRDHIEDDDGSVYRTIAQIGDTTCSQVMFVMGTDDAGLSHPNWRENLKLALHMQNEMNTLYPSLAKPIKLSDLRYNQQATTGSMLIEVGSTGNTLQEALTAVRYFAEAASNVILGLYT
jgi:stage II sporulation protein P